MKTTFLGTSAALACGSLAVLWVAALPAASAHTSLRNNIQHRAALDVGPANIDVTLELTFHEDRSMAERARMDANRDGRICRTETLTYLASKVRDFDKSLGLSLNDDPLELVPLYDPTLDLAGETRVRPHTHVLRLHYFLPTPQRLVPGGVLALTDRLWPETGALRSIEVNATGGFRFASLPVLEPGVWRARCQAAPAGRDLAVPLHHPQDQR